jgi:hypothetical protein
MRTDVKNTKKNTYFFLPALFVVAALFGVLCFDGFTIGIFVRLKIYALGG